MARRFAPRIVVIESPDGSIGRLREEHAAYNPLGPNVAMAGPFA